MRTDKQHRFSRVYIKIIATYSLVLIIPIIIFSVYFYSTTHTHSLQNAQSDRIASLNQLSENMMLQHNTIQRLSLELSSTDSLSEFNILNGNTPHYRINQELKKLTAPNTYVNATFYYLKKTGTLYNQNGNYSLQQFNTPHFQYYYPQWEHEDMEEFLNQTETPTIRASETVVIPSNNPRQMLTYLYPLKRGNHVYGVMLSLVDRSQMNTILDNAILSDTENILTYSNTGALLSQRSPLAPKLLEELRQLLEQSDNEGSVVMTIDEQDCLISYTAQSPYTWRFLSILPVSSISSSTSYIFSELMLVLIIVLITGVLAMLFGAHSSYNPLQKLLSLMEVSLKPSRQKNEYDLLRESITALKDQTKNKEKGLRVNFIYQILLNRYESGTELHAAAQEYGLSFQLPYFTVAIIKSGAESDTRTRNELLTHLTQPNTNHVLRSNVQGSFIPGIGCNETIFVCACASEASIIAHMNTVFSANALDFSDLYIGIGTLQSSPKTMDAAYYTAALAADALMIKNLPGVLSGSDLSQIEKNMPTFPIKQIHSLSFAAVTKDRKQLETALNQLLPLMRHLDTPVYMVRLLYCTIMSILENALLQYEPSAEPDFISQANIFGKSIYFTELEASISAVSKKLYAHMDVVSDVPVSPSIRIEQVEAYIAEHMRSYDFSIASLAEHFGTSVSNMSHYFKTQTGVGYKQYVDYLRIEYAKVLLSDSNQTINDIATECGYVNPSSFIRTYKKITGLTPGMYRKETQHEDRNF